MKLPEKIKLASLAFWKFEKHHMIGALECKNADVFTVSRSFMTYETEVKVSIADMQREIGTKNLKHRCFREEKQLYPSTPFTHYFYFAVPDDLYIHAMDVIHDRYPYAGLLVFKDTMNSIYKPNGSITMIKHAKKFNRIPMDNKELLEIGYQATNTALRYMEKHLASPTLIKEGNNG